MIEWVQSIVKQGSMMNEWMKNQSMSSLDVWQQVKWIYEFFWTGWNELAAADMRRLLVSLLELGKPNSSNVSPFVRWTYLVGVGIYNANDQYSLFSVEVALPQIIQKKVKVFPWFILLVRFVSPLPLLPVSNYSLIFQASHAPWLKRRLMNTGMYE